MKPILLIAALLLAAGCQVQPRQAARRVDPKRDAVLRRVNDLPAKGVAEYAASVEVPMMNLPLKARQSNWGGGSCVVASTVSLLRWQGYDEMAARFRRLYAGGQTSASMNAKLSTNHVRFAYTTRGDIRFLEWCIRTRRGAGITYFPGHFVNLTDLTKTHAYLMDNNRVAQTIRIPRREFEQRWRSWGGWALTVCYSPPPPLSPNDFRYASASKPHRPQDGP